MNMQKGAFMRGLDNMIIKDIPMPVIGDDEVEVKLDYVGICGSDVHFYHTGSCGTFKVNLNEDFMLGHECAGTITKVGKDVTTLTVGDRVAIEPGIACGKCDLCKSGKYNLCPDVKFLAAPPVPGCNAQYISFPAEMCFKLPDNVSSKEGALIEPLSVGFYAAKQAGVEAGDDVLILGSGCIGLMTLLSCKARGAGRIVIADLEESRLNKAIELGANVVINSSKEDIFETVNKITDGKGFDKVFEAAGSTVTIAQTPFLVKIGGTVVLVGMASKEEVDYNFAQIMSKEATIKSVFRYKNVYASAIAAVSSGAICLDGIATHEFEFDDIDKAYKEALTNKNTLVKAVIKIS